MANLTLKEISEFNHPLAFARQRTEPVGRASASGSVGSALTKGPMVTNSMSESYSLLSGLTERLGMIRSNLVTMLQLANQGGAARSQTVRDEMYGKLRSLSGGVDDIVDATVWNGEQMLTGRSLNLSLSQTGKGGTRIDLSSYYTSQEDGLNLTRQPESAKTDVYYDFYSAMRNSTSGIVGLDIKSASASAVDATHEELETGIYQIEVTYMGPESSVALKDADGIVVSNVKNVDLSGSGVEQIDMGVGVAIQIDKTQYLSAVDKYDYETKGPAKFMAKLAYDRVYRHDLYQEGFEPVSTNALSVTSNRPIRDAAGTGKLSISSIGLAGVKDDVLGLDSGVHSIRVNYNGAKSSVELRDAQGRIKYLNFKVDLSGDEPVTIDTGQGLKFSVANEGYADAKGQLNAIVDYTRAANDNTSFDFSSYSNNLNAAIDKIDKDMQALDVMSQNILILNSFQAGGGGMGGLGSGTVALGLVNSALGGGSDFFSSAYANTILGSVGSSLMDNISSAMSAQAQIASVRASSTVA